MSHILRSTLDAERRASCLMHDLRRQMNERQHFAPKRGDSFAPLYSGVPRIIFTQPRPWYRRISLRGWVWIVGTVGSTAFWGYLLWSLK